MRPIIFVNANNIDEARQKAAAEMNLPLDAINVRKLDSVEEDVLEGATPLAGRYRAEIKPERLMKMARETLTKLFQTMHIMAECRANLIGQLIHLRVASPEKKLIVGRKGATLEAITHFINRAVSANDKDLPYVYVSVEGFNDLRIKRLERISFNAIKQVRANKQKVTLKPMKPDDRKIIHNIVKGVEGVTSFSQGEEGKRCVVITPVNTNHYKNPQLAGGVF